MKQQTPAAPGFDYLGYEIRRGAGINALAKVIRKRIPLKPGELRVRMRAAALNYRDLMVARGDSGAFERSFIPASDGAGEVIEVASDVEEFKVGDRVLSTFFPDWISGPVNAENAARALGGTYDGVLAEEVILPRQSWVAMPAHLDFIEAATLTCAGVTAWNALFCAATLTPGDTVLLLGTGGVSIWALQLAKAAGMRVIMTSSDDRKLEHAIALGADAVVNYRTTPAWEKEVLRLTDGRGVQRVLEVGGADTLSRSIAATVMGGSIAIIGRLTGTSGQAFDPAALFSGAKRMLGILIGSRSMTQDLARFVALHEIHPVIDTVFSFDEVQQAYRYLESARHFGKVVVRL